MRRTALRVVLLLAPVLALAALTLDGCNNPTNPTGGSSGAGAGSGGPGKTPVKKTGLTEVEGKGTATLKGRATLDGPAPTALIKEMDAKLTEQIDKNNNKDICLKGSEDEKSEQEWKIGKDGGVANVVVWLKPPAGQFFKVDLDKPTWKKEVALEQPHCAFEPHVFVLFPEYMDPKTKKLKATGQKFVVKNNAPMNHNTKWAGGTKNPGDNVTLTPKQEKDVELKPDANTPVTFACNIHQWMNGYAWVLDHPYAAVTDKDGNFEIKDAPAGVELEVVAWHEPGTWLTGGSSKGEKITLKEGDNTKNFKVPSPK